MTPDGKLFCEKVRVAYYNRLNGYLPRENCDLVVAAICYLRLENKSVSSHTVRDVIKEMGWDSCWDATGENGDHGITRAIGDILGEHAFHLATIKGGFKRRRYDISWIDMKASNTIDGIVNAIVKRIHPDAPCIAQMQLFA